MNNKGFMLAEVVIVSTILLTTIVGLYSGFANTYKAYELRNSYYDAKTIYGLKNLEDFLIDEMLLTNLVSNNNFSYVEINADTFSDDYYKAFLEKFSTTYNIKNIYLVKYDETIITNFSNNSNEELKDYLDFYIERTKEENSSYIFDDSLYSYLLVSVTNDDTYSSLRIR